MNFFDQQFATADKFLQLLDRPRLFQQQRREDFFNGMNQSRETFVENHMLTFYIHLQNKNSYYVSIPRW